MGRDLHAPRARILEDEYYALVGNSLLRQSAAAVGALGKATEIFPGYGAFVGESR